MHVCVLSRFSHVQLCDPIDCNHQAPLSLGFSRQEDCMVAMPFSGDLPNQGIKPESLTSPALAGGLFTTSATWKAHLPQNLREILENQGGKRSFFLKYGFYLCYHGAF